MERDVMDIVKEKEFIELTASERAELGELCSSEEEFNQVKAMFAGIGAMDWSNPTPKAETKESLDHLFVQKYPKAAPVWYNAPLAVVAPKGKPFYRQPLVQAAAVGLLIFLAYPFVKSNVMTSDTTQVAVLEAEKTSSEVKETESGLNEEAVVEGDLNQQAESSEAVRNDNLAGNQVTLDVASKPEIPSPAPSGPARSVDLVSFSATRKATSSKDMEFRVTAGDGGAIQPGSTHPDGIFIGDKAEIFSVPASREPAVFDLLTSTF